MPLIRLKRPDGVYVTNCSGVTEIETILEFVREIPVVMGPDGEWFEIAIHEVDSVRSTDYEDNQRIRVEAIKSLAQVKKGAVALVGLSAVNYGTLRQLTLIMNNEPIPMEAFDNVEEAEAWIAARREAATI